MWPRPWLTLGGIFFGGGVWVSLDARAATFSASLLLYYKEKKTTTNAHVSFFIAILAEKGDGIFYAVKMVPFF